MKTCDGVDGCEDDLGSLPIGWLSEIRSSADDESLLLDGQSLRVELSREPMRDRFEKRD